MVGAKLKLVNFTQSIRKKNMTYKRDYKAEYANYDGTEAVKKKRAQRNKARRMLEREGVVHKGDGKDVDHVKPLSKGGKNVLSNLRVVDANINDSMDRNSDHSVKANKPNKKIVARENKKNKKK